MTVKNATPTSVEVSGAALTPGQFATGDYFCKPANGADEERRQIVECTANAVTIAAANPWRAAPAPGSRVEIQVRLQQPNVDPRVCTGCGICEHECPVSGLRAIRVTAENETRNRKHSLLL